MKSVFIIGSRGYKAKYGGWETFVTNLVDNYKDKNTKFYISEYTNDKNKSVYKVNDNIIIFPIYVSNFRSATMFIYTIKAFKYCYKYIKDNNINNSFLYVLGLKLFIYLMLYKKRLCKLNIVTLVNPDGLEHLRSKWSYPVKKFFLISERLMLNNCDVIVCDAKGIKNYVINKYPGLKDKTTYIAYGFNKINLDNIKEKEILKKYNLSSFNYCLLVGRCVPENNYELIINDYINSKIDKDLIIISNISGSNYYNELINKTDCLSDKRIHFIDGVYDPIELAVIRKNAYLYIHRHSVGGTNPSLIEALSLTDVNVLYDVCFNRDVGLDSCLYFKNNNDLTNILNNNKKIDNDRKKMGDKAKKIVNDNFTWDIIVNKYKKLLKKVNYEKKAEFFI